MDIKQHILTLISQEEMAYIPNLGGIMSKQTTARLDASTHIFYPPTKELAFNDRLVTSDSKLAALISNEENCSLSEAEKQIASFVDMVKKELSVHQKYTLEDIGTFHSMEQGTITFQSKLSSKADSHNFGLPSILINNFIKEESNKKIFSKPKDRNAMSTLDLQSVPDPASPGDNPPNTRPGKKEPATSSLTWLYVLTPIVLLGLFGIFLGITEDGKKMLSSMTSIGSKQEDTTSTPSPASELETATETAVVTQDATPAAVESFDNAVSAEETIKKTEKEKWGEEPTKSKQEAIAKSEEVTYSTANIITGKSGRYFVIVGGFLKKRNAVKLREKLINDGLESKVLAPMEEGGLYRVSLADYDNLEAALKKADELKASHGDNLWVKSY
jgi:cell division protein FtsN